MNNQKRFALFVLAALAVGGRSASYAGQANDPTAPAVGSPSTDTFLPGDPNLSNQRDVRLDSRELFFKMMLATALVIVLAVTALYLSRKVLPKVARVSSKEIRILETTYLGPRKALHLVQVGPHKLLIGSTSESITSLAQIVAGTQQATEDR